LAIWTRLQIRETFAGVRERIAGVELCLDGTIEDYPMEVALTPAQRESET